MCLGFSPIKEVSLCQEVEVLNQYNEMNMKKATPVVEMKRSKKHHHPR